jgi:hypothetical protein
LSASVVFPSAVPVVFANASPIVCGNGKVCGYATADNQNHKRWKQQPFHCSTRTMLVRSVPSLFIRKTYSTALH